ncbi:hypothetical protein LINPERPRIM_LOCUS5034 [Linum perenne]
MDHIYRENNFLAYHLANSAHSMAPWCTSYR